MAPTSQLPALAGANLIFRGVVANINLALTFSRGDHSMVRPGKVLSLKSSSESREIKEVSNSNIAEKLDCTVSA